MLTAGDIFKAVMTEEKFAKRERYKIDRKHSHSIRLTNTLPAVWCCVLAGMMVEDEVFDCRVKVKVVVT